MRRCTPRRCAPPGRCLPARNRRGPRRTPDAPRTASADGRGGSSRPSRARDRKRRGGIQRADPAARRTLPSRHGPRRRRRPRDREAPRPRARRVRRLAIPAAGLGCRRAPARRSPPRRVPGRCDTSSCCWQRRRPGSRVALRTGRGRREPRRRASPRGDRCRRTPGGAPPHRSPAPRTAPAPSTGVRRSRIPRETARRR